MFRSTVLFFLVGYVHGCNRLTQYSDCVNKGTLSVMGCEAFNSAVGDKTYYTCLCETNKELYDCYTLCADDATLQLEAQTAKQRVDMLCQQASEKTNSVPSVPPVPFITSTSTTRKTMATPTTTPSPVTTTVVQVPTRTRAPNANLDISATIKSANYSTTLVMVCMAFATLYLLT